MTEYVILVQDTQGHWEDVGRTSARSTRSALSQAIEGPTGATPKEGRFVAVPARSFVPVTVEVVPRTTLKFVK